MLPLLILCFLTPTTPTDLSIPHLQPRHPYFDPSTPTNITAQLGSHGFLPCRVKQLGNKSVSWIRKRDSHILTVDRYTFINDDRFGMIHTDYESWTLQIKYLQERDGGLYECQVTTESKLSNLISLQVIVPQTKIFGETDLFVKSGSSVSLKCVITDSLEPPDYVFWYHDGGRVLSLEDKWQTIERLSADTTLAVLTIKWTSQRDSGNYTCSPSNLTPAWLLLHVLHGEVTAMQQHTISSTNKPLPIIALVLSLISLINL